MRGKGLFFNLNLILLLELITTRHPAATDKLFKALYVLELCPFLAGEFRSLVRDMKMPKGSFLISGQNLTYDLMRNLKFES